MTKAPRWLEQDSELLGVHYSIAAFQAGSKQCAMTFIDITERKRAEEKLAEQLRELQRRHAVMLDREDRIIELKREVNELLARAGQPPRYASAVETREK